jgi:hypothetical protein
MMHLRARALALALSISMSTYATAGRPLQAEDAGVLESTACEVEAATSGLRKTGAPSMAAQGLQLGCGIGAQSQLALALSRSRSAGVSEPAARLGGKTRLWSASDAGAVFTLAWGLSAARAAGDSWRYSGLDLGAVFSTPLGGATLHANLGHLFDKAARTAATRWAAAWEADAINGWAPMAEVFGDDRSAPWWNLGLRYTAIADKWYFDLSCGQQIASTRPRLATAGLKWAF